jgi:hypothetical protein
MKMLLVALVVLAASFAWYTNIQEKKKQTELLQKEVTVLEAQNSALEKKAQTDEQKVATTTSAEQKRVSDLKIKLDAESAKLTAFQQRKMLLTAALNDPGQASSLSEVDSEIREKNGAIQSLQLQLSTHQDAEKNVDHDGEAARQNTNLSKTQAMADLNARIQAQQDLIQNTQASIQQMKSAGDVNSGDQIRALGGTLLQQKNDLKTLRASKDQVNVEVAAQNVQIHQAVGFEKGSIRASEQEIRAQIQSLKNEVTALQSQKGGVTRSKAQVQQQATYLDQQISSEKTEISRIKALINSERP